MTLIRALMLLVIPLGLGRIGYLAAQAWRGIRRERELDERIAENWKRTEPF